MAALAGPFADAETLTVTRDLLNILGSEHYYTEEYCDVNTDFRSHYLMNLPLRNLIQLLIFILFELNELTEKSGVEYADCIVLVGINPRLEGPLLNLRLQHAVHQQKARVGIVGLKMNLGYKTHHLGASPDTISDLADGVHPWCEQLFSAKRPMILAGSGIHARPDSHGFNIELQRLTETIKSNVKQDSDDGIVSLNFVTFSILHLCRTIFSTVEFSINFIYMHHYRLPST